VTGPAVSILLPAWNGATFLAEQLDSILAQSLGDFELLVVDDGSTDATPEILAGYAARDRRIRLLPAAGNRGQKARLLELLGEARAPLVAVSDQDDVWDPGKLAALAAGLGDAALAFGRSDLIDSTGAPLGRTLLESCGSLPGEARISLFFSAQVSGHAMLVRREAVTETAFRRAEPYDWLISLDSALSGGIRYVDEAVVRHRMHGANQSNASFEHRVRGLARLRPARVREALRSIARRRYHFVQRLEHVAHSPVVPEAARRDFARLEAWCREAWFSPGFSGRGLSARLLGTLRPYSAGERDWAVAVDHVTGLTQGAWHPRSAYQTAKAILWY
jgi:glycosyltransferase involved in cell wall biosynthesis